jgi:methanogenic corrinoid protein MtbC1
VLQRFTDDDELDVTTVAISEPLYQEYLRALLQGNSTDCARLVTQLLDHGVAIRALYVELIHRSMYEVGSLWQANRISVAREHLATAITEEMLELIYPRLFAEGTVGARVIVATLPGEYHQIGAKVIADIFEVNGWDSHFLGGHDSEAALLKRIDELRPDLLAQSISVSFNLPQLHRVLGAVREAYPMLPILIGGQGLKDCGHEVSQSYLKIDYVSSITALEAWLES